MALTTMLMGRDLQRPGPLAQVVHTKHAFRCWKSRWHLGQGLTQGSRALQHGHQLCMPGCQGVPGGGSLEL